MKKYNLHRKHNIKKKLILLLLFMMTIIGVAYAALNAELSINGTTKISSNTWDIHFENIQVTEGSVAIGTGNQAATIVTESSVSFAVDLNNLGDFYEFTVDVKNAGTIDGMVGSISSKLNNTPITTLPNYLNYTVTYSDDEAIALNQKLPASSKDTIKIRVEVLKDIEAEDLPSTEQNLSFLFELGYVQADSEAINVVHTGNLYLLLQREATSNGLARAYTGEHNDTLSGSGAKTIYHWYATSDAEGTSIQDKNNVIFGGFCWQIIRTTDTGGVKIMYNGVPSEGKCTATGANTAILNSMYSSNNTTPLYAGYMLNKNILVFGVSGAPDSGVLFGKSVSYNNGTFTLQDTSNTLDSTHHYTCNSTENTCTTIRYYRTSTSYLKITGYENVEAVLNKMLNDDNVNSASSVIKEKIDSWYENNMTSYTDKLEDVIFCNNRKILSLGGLNPNGGPLSGTDSYLTFKDYNTTNTDLSCENITDQLSVANNKAKLTYPVALATLAEINLVNNNVARSSGDDYWVLSPHSLQATKIYLNQVDPSGAIIHDIPNASIGLRPVVSLAPGTNYTTGEGTKNNPYIIP